jgi:hypothetical protein
MKPARKPKPRPGPRAEASPVYVRLTPEERREVVEAAERAALPIGVWARSILVRAARTERSAQISGLTDVMRGSPPHGRGSGVPDRKEER